MVGGFTERPHWVVDLKWWWFHGGSGFTIGVVSLRFDGETSKDDVRWRDRGVILVHQ